MNICVMPARGGSKRISKKKLKNLMGNQLLNNYL